MTEIARSLKPRLRVRLTAVAESIVRAGHPWIFAESIREQNRNGEMGELAIIFDRHDEFLAVGLFDPDSPLRIRVLHAGKPRNVDEDFFRQNLVRSLSLREKIFDARTNGYRCINGENESWPGLVLDRYDKTFVLKIYTAVWLPWLNQILDLLGENVSSERIVLRLSRNIQKGVEQNFGLSDGRILRGEPLHETVVFLENGLRFEADVLRGQKTGFFLDQRENRSAVEKLARGRKVLNVFSFSGGFSVYAARGGASSVTSLDISPHALASTEKNFSLNQDNAAIAHCRHEMIQADAFEWFQSNSGQFDLIVLDPPSLAKRASEKPEAIRAYSNLLGSAIERLSANGILVAASCSAHVSADEFFQIARQCARRSGRKFAELKTTEHAADHLATFAEGHYLKCIYLRFGNT